MMVYSFNTWLTGIALLCAIQVRNASSQATPIKLKRHSEGYDKPTAIVDAKDGKKLLYIVERGGTIRKVKRTSGKVKSKPYLNVTSLLGPCEGYCEERGLLGLVFHPEHKTNGYFYINYTTEDSEGKLWTVVSRFSRKSTKPSFADETSEVIILKFEQTWANHNAGDLQFGPDGYLYVTSGDGGYFGDPDNFGQDLTTMLGKLLRIDVDQFSTGYNYAIPPTNPFVSDPNALSEIWAYGLRNPWKISFDRDNGDLFIADVGQNRWEEIDFQPSTSTGGENYGWRLMEGNHCYNPAVNCTDSVFGTLTMPILEYEHAEGACSVTGGYMYRGKKWELDGSYYFGDYCNGTIWAGTMDDNGAWTADVVMQSSGIWISSFGEDVLGNHYVADYVNGTVYKIFPKRNPCLDSKTYFYNDLAKKTCDWIDSKKHRAKRLCQNNEVFNNCKNTCNNRSC